MGKKINKLNIYILACFFTSWLLWLFSNVVVDKSPHLNAEIFMKLGDFVPSIGALLYCSLTSGKKGIICLLNRTVKLDFPLRWYALAIVLMPSIVGIAYLIGHTAFGLEFNSLIADFFIPKVWCVMPLILFFVLLTGPLGEELGWRGIILPGLLMNHNPFSASIILGVIWSIWHLPKFMMPATIQGNLTVVYGLPLALAGYTVYTVLLTLIITVLYFQTSGSIFAAMLFHGMSNFSHGLFTILTSHEGAVLILAILLFFTVALWKWFQCYMNQENKVKLESNTNV